MTAAAARVGARATPSVSLPSGPWGPVEALVLLGVHVGVGLLGLLAWWSASGRTTLADQVGELSLATAGVAVALGVDLWFVARARRAVLQAGAAALADLRPAAHAAAIEEDEVAVATGWTALPVGGLAHRDGCPLVAGKPAEAVTVAAIRDRGLRRCGVCGPAGVSG